MNHTPENLAQTIASSKEFFDRSSACLGDDHEAFRPTGELMTVAQQVAHVAKTVDWFIEGATRPEGFNVDVDTFMGDVLAVTSLEAARLWTDASFAKAATWVEGQSIEELSAPLPEGPVMGSQPRLNIVAGIEEHTAHHRGALMVYARLCGVVPRMPYMDMP